MKFECQRKSEENNLLIEELTVKIFEFLNFDKWLKILIIDSDPIRMLRKNAKNLY